MMIDDGSYDQMMIQMDQGNFSFWYKVLSVLY